MKYDFCGGTYKTFSDIINAEECVNFLPIVEKNKTVLRGTPGLKEWKDSGNYAEVRGEKVMNDRLYSVIGDAVYRTDKSKVQEQCTGSTLATKTGKVSMASNGTQIMIADGIYGYIVESTTVTKITDGSFPDEPTTVTELDGYFVTTHVNSGRCYISDLRDGESWDSTRYFNAESNPDNSLCAFASHREVKIFGKNSIEPWYDSGDTVPFDRSPGTQESGIGAIHSPSIIGNSLYYFTNTLEIAKIEGISPIVVSPPFFSHLVSQYSKTDDAIGMTATIEGNPLYILTFPYAKKTWCYHILSESLCQLASYPEPFDNVWRGNCIENFDNKWIVGDYENGKLYELDFNTFLDNDQTIRRKRIGPAIFDEDGRDISFHELQILFEPGTGLATGQGSSPQAMLRWLDYGKEWSNEHLESVNKIGDYRDRAIWHVMGSSRHRNYEISVTDPIKWVIRGASLRASVGMA